MRSTVQGGGKRRNISQSCPIDRPSIKHPRSRRPRACVTARLLTMFQLTITLGEYGIRLVGLGADGRSLTWVEQTFLLGCLAFVWSRCHRVLALLKYQKS